MARLLLSPDEEFSNSPFGANPTRSTRRRSRYIKARPYQPRNTLHNRQMFSLLIEFIAKKCVNKGIRPEMNIRLAVNKLTGHPMRAYSCWEWAIDEFEKANSDLLAQEEGFRLAIAYARGRIFSMWEADQIQLRKSQIARDAEQRQRQYAEERAANGGAVDFFNSNTWQRLRFEVLAESEGCCVLCGRSYREHQVALEVDHIKPRSRFPNLALDKDNLQVLCFDCNRGKGNRDTTDWRPQNEDDCPEEQVA